jgi:IclR family mhp operon transcriptional activator
MLDIAIRHGTIAGDRAWVAERIAMLQVDYAERGYAWAVGGADHRISAIALPLSAPIQGAQVIGSINLLFFTSAMGVEAAQRFLPCACRMYRRIEAQLASEAA